MVTSDAPSVHGERATPVISPLQATLVTLLTVNWAGVAWGFVQAAHWGRLPEMTQLALLTLPDDLVVTAVLVIVLLGQRCHSRPPVRTDA